MGREPMRLHDLERPSSTDPWGGTGGLRRPTPEGHRGTCFTSDIIVEPPIAYRAVWTGEKEAKTAAGEKAFQKVQEDAENAIKRLGILPKSRSPVH